MVLETVMTICEGTTSLKNEPSAEVDTADFLRFVRKSGIKGVNSGKDRGEGN